MPASPSSQGAGVDHLLRWLYLPAVLSLNFVRIKGFLVMNYLLSPTCAQHVGTIRADPLILGYFLERRLGTRERVMGCELCASAVWSGAKQRRGVALRTAGLMGVWPGVTQQVK